MGLESYCFVKVGEWRKRKSGERKNKSGIYFTIIKKFKNIWKERVIYAFVVRNKTKYIGICDKRKPPKTTLEERMIRYRNRQGGGTNEKIAKKIRSLIKKPVQIYAMKPTCRKYKKLDIDIVRGLEYPLIEKFGTLTPNGWNKKG